MMQAEESVAAADGPARVAGQWLANAHAMDLPPEVVAAARTCLIDWFACTVAGMQDPLLDILQRLLKAWSPTGSAPLLSGGYAAPPFAAMFHSTAAHATDFDDTHIWTDAHFSGPTWAALLAHVKEGQDLDEQLLLRAFVAGFEVGARLGGRRLGHALLHRGFQATGLLGRLSAAAACSVLRGLDARHAAVALTIAGCQTSGLSTTVGTMLKPFQGGKTAFDAVISVDLASEGLTADPALLDHGGGPERSAGIGGLARALVQDGFAELTSPDFSSGWEILRNSIKAYPCLYSLNPVADAACRLSGQLKNKNIGAIKVYVGPSVPKVARYSRPTSSHEGRFSIEYCAVLGLLGRSYCDADFAPDVMSSVEVQRLIERVEVVPTEGRKMFNARIDVTLSTGETLVSDVPFVKGHPQNPLTSQELEAKFRMLVEPTLKSATGDLLQALNDFPMAGSISRAIALARGA